MGRSLALNRRAARLADRLLEQGEALGVSAAPVGAARVIDCGIAATGGLEAGRQFSEICMGGLGQVTLVPWQAGEICLPGVQVVTDQPVAACLGAQYAGWAIKGEGFFAMGSGPARALARVEKLFEHLPVAEQGDEAVLCLEGRKLPDAAVLARTAERCGVALEQLTVLIAPTASLVGSVQVSARVLETALHKLHELGFDITAVRSGMGWAPIAPVARGDLEAIGRTNDCLLYGGRVHLTVDAPDEALSEVIGRVPASSSGDYGRTFLELFRQYGDFYKIDPLLFSPAVVTLTSLRSGRSFTAGQINMDVLQQSFQEG